MKQVVFCLKCGEMIGDYKKNFAEKHQKKCSCNKGYLVKTMIDPLILPDPDEWFNKHKERFVRLVDKPTGNTNKTTEDVTEPKMRHW